VTSSKPQPLLSVPSPFWLSPFRLPLVLAVLVLALDQWTKLLVLQKLELGEARPVFDSFFHLVHYRNTGAAWGMFQGKTFLLGILSMVILVAMVWKFSHLVEGRRERALALGLVIGGTLGNLYDRLFRGEVVDFLLFFFREFRWPAFNIADAAICFGVVVYVYSSLFLNGSAKGAQPGHDS